MFNVRVSFLSKLHNSVTEVSTKTPLISRFNHVEDYFEIFLGLV